MHNLKKLRNSLRLQRKQLKILIVGGSISVFLTNQEILIRDSLFSLHAVPESEIKISTCPEILNTVNEYFESK